MLSRKQIVQLSRTEIVSTELYRDLKPVSRGPLDLRMGVGSKANTCETCGLKLERCIGHFGHLRLCMPVYHIGFFKHLLNVLKCVCKKCGKVMMQEPEKVLALARLKALRFNYTARAAHMKKLLKECNSRLSCEACGYQNPKVQKVPKLAGRIDAKQLTRYYPSLCSGEDAISVLRGR